LVSIYCIRSKFSGFALASISKWLKKNCPGKICSVTKPKIKLTLWKPRVSKKRPCTLIYQNWRHFVTSFCAIKKQRNKNCLHHQFQVDYTNSVAFASDTLLVTFLRVKDMNSVWLLDFFFSFAHSLCGWWLLLHFIHDLLSGHKRPHKNISSSRHWP